MNFIKEITGLYRKQKSQIIRRLNKFKNFSKMKNDNELFSELCFCLLTPQSKAKLCWNAVLKLKENNLLFEGTAEQIQKFLINVRFHMKKSEYILQARKILDKLKKLLVNTINPEELRVWLVKNIKGMGYKEASHFLRNIGIGENFAILDRHILKNSLQLKIIDEIPGTLTVKKYVEIEYKLRKFAKKINIPIAHLDLLLWSKETGEIFK
ncbi:MAG: N-glycosylase/DNA lyase [Elusimicrobiota bacterium]